MNDEITGESLAPIFDYAEEELGRTSLKQLIELAGIRDYLADDQRYRMLSSGNINTIAKACRKKSNWFSVEFGIHLFRSTAELIRQAGQDKDDYTVTFEIGYKSCEKDIRKIGILRDTKSEDPGRFYEKTPRYVNILNRVWNIGVKNRTHSIEFPIFLDLTSQYIGKDSSKKIWNEANKKFEHLLEKIEFRLDYIEIRWGKYNADAVFDFRNCKYTEGIFSGVPHIIGLPDPYIVNLEEYTRESPYVRFGILYLRRDPSFEEGYNVKRTIKNLFLRILSKAYNFITEKKSLKEELKQKEVVIANLFEGFDKAVENLVTQIADAQESKIHLEKKVNERTQELRETQSKLLEAEKRTLEHRITGGFAHEMRNALSGAQLELNTIRNYKNKGKPSAEVLKDSATSLLKNITLIHEKYDIPKEEIATDFIPELKTIAEIADHLSGVHSGVSKDLNRGFSITTQIRDYAKMSEMKPGDTPIDLIPLLREYESRYSQDFERIGITYIMEGIDKAVVKADEIHINSIFSNIILNARDALEEQGGEGKAIRVTVERQDHEDRPYFIIKVQDNGPGIPEAHLNEIFEPFFSTKPTSGTGLGLGVVRRLVQLYEGEIAVESKVGEGTTFAVTLMEKLSE